MPQAAATQQSPRWPVAGPSTHVRAPPPPPGSHHPPVADALAHDLGGEHEVVEVGLVHGGQGPGAGALRLAAVLGGRQDAAHAHNHHILACGGPAGKGNLKGG